MIHRPLARARNLIVEELGEECLVYDTETDRGHCLSPAAARVWRLCDGKTPVGDLSGELGLDEATVQRALDELTACELLEARPQLTPSNGGTTRRELTVKVVKAGAAVAAAPLIVSVAAPEPAAALTPPPGCEGIFTCLFDCGQTEHGCQGAGCTCCQLGRIDCDDDVLCNGVNVQRPADVKWCILGPANECPPQSDPCLCTTPCPAPVTGRTRTGSATSGETQTAPTPSSGEGGGAAGGGGTPEEVTPPTTTTTPAPPPPPETTTTTTTTTPAPTEGGTTTTPTP